MIEKSNPKKASKIIYRFWKKENYILEAKKAKDEIIQMFIEKTKEN